MLKHLQERVALRAVAVASFSAAMCSSGVAAADLDSRMKWLSAGANFGVSNQAGRTDWIAGGEVSVGAIKELLWAGAYLDAVYDSGADSVRLSVGPEVGFLVLGVDGGERAGGNHRLLFSWLRWAGEASHLGSADPKIRRTLRRVRCVSRFQIGRAHV